MASYKFPKNVKVPPSFMENIDCGIFLKRRKNIFFLCACEAEIKVSRNDDVGDLKFSNAIVHLSRHCLVNEPQPSISRGAVFMVSTLEEAKDPENEIWSLPEFDPLTVKKTYTLFFQTACISIIVGAIIGSFMTLQFNLDQMV